MSEQSDMTELLGCPFCAADCAELTKAMGEAWVRCPHCDATGGMSSHPELAVKNWNARALTTASGSDAVAIPMMQNRDDTLRGLAEFFSESIHTVWSNDEIARCLTEMIGHGSKEAST